MIVIDVSIAAPMVLPDEPPVPEDLMRLLLNEELIAPAHWPVEAVNMLLSAERRCRLTSERRARAAAFLQQLNVAVVAGPERIWQSATSLAIEHGLTVYDAAYLDLAMARGARLATLDRELVAAAERVGVELLTY